MQNVRIAYLCSSKSWGGLEMNHLKCAIWMKELGYSTYVFALKSSPLYINAINENIDVVEISEHKKVKDFEGGEILAKQLDDNLITHLVIRDKWDISVSGIAKSKSQRKIHLSYFMAMQIGVLKRGLIRAFRYNRIDLWSCPSKFLRNQVRLLTNVFWWKIKIIPDGIDLDYLQTPIEKNIAREQLDLPKDKTILGVIGRFDKLKGQLLAIEALSKIEDENVVLCLLGEPTLEDGEEFLKEMKSKIEELNLTNRVFIRPFRKDVTPFYYSINALIMSSKSETFGMVTIEAMACGKPVIASNKGGSPEILEFGKVGYLFESMNVTSLSQQIQNYLGQPDKYSSKKLQKTVEKYSKSNSCQLVIESLKI